MDCKECIDGIKSFMDKLQDEESKEIFEAWFDFCIHRDSDVLERKLISGAIRHGRKGNSYILDNFFQEYPDRKEAPFVIFGAGRAGRASIRSLKFLGLEVAGCVDNKYALVETAEGFVVDSPERLLVDWENCTVLIAVVDRKVQDDIYGQLKVMGIPESRIMKIREGYIWADYGRQYFDLDVLQADHGGEIFVDAGCYDGETGRGAAAWAGGKLSKIYAFEADQNSINTCRKRMEETGCEFELYHLATWSGKTILTFNVNSDFGYASSVDAGGKESVNADSIDNILAGGRATYIKLDVEGNELETLKGAVNTIKKYRPKMAVSIYHKPEDIIDLPLFIESLGMNYKYYIRHYQTRWCETTLYAL